VAQNKIADFSSQDVSNLAWAVATLAYDDAPLLRALETRAIQNRRELAPQNLSNLLWAFATLGYFNQEVFDLIDAVRSWSEFDSQHITNIAWSYASLRVRNIPLLGSIAAEAAQRSQQFGYVDCAISVWAFAALMVCARPMVEAIAVRSVVVAQEFDTQNLSNLAWALAALEYADVPLLATIAGRTVLKARQFSPQELANTTWAFLELSLLTETLQAALSAAAAQCADASQGQALGALVDADLPCREELESRLGNLVNNFLEVWCPNQSWDADLASTAVQIFKMDSLGRRGSRMLLGKLGIPEASPEFVGRAENKISQARTSDALPQSPGYGWRRTRVLAYCEYRFEGDTATGSLMCENGLHGEGLAGHLRWLTPTQLPLSSWVDRALCAEAQLLSLLCTQRELANLHGEVELYTSAPPCLSCLGIFVQFSAAFPKATFRFSCGLARGWQAWEQM